MFGKSYVLIDFSNLVYISFFASYKGKPDEVPLFYSDHVEYFRKALNGYRRWNGLAEFVFALDSKPHAKYELFPDYKKSRSKLCHKDGSFFDAQKAIIEEFGDMDAVQASGFEADDVIASFVADKFDYEVTVITTDKDIWQISDHPKARVYDPFKREYITKAHLREAFCRKDKHKVIHEHLTEFSQIKLYKSLWGDSGDSVPNVVPRMQKQLLPVIAQTDGTLGDFYERMKANEVTTKCKSLVESAKDRIAVNDALVRLNFGVPMEFKRLVDRVVEPKPTRELAQTEINLDKLF